MVFWAKKKKIDSSSTSKASFTFVEEGSKTKKRRGGSLFAAREGRSAS